MIALPIDQVEPYQDFAIELDGLTRIFHFRYHTREERYYFGIYDLDNAPIQLGTKVLCGVALLKARSRQILPGQIYAHTNNAQDDSPPKLGDLGLPSAGVRVNLFYVTAEECKAIANG